MTQAQVQIVQNHAYNTSQPSTARAQPSGGRQAFKTLERPDWGVGPGKRMLLERRS
eukprot:CAMPEP_0184539506 /NCGR_PEP_ID=MMETSP0198_2-20121128/18168_1 /TAXON_ID=1112570 /ORGANISM="Thraustochytrium sp., Strain LLF1b" /LENGTH=55 /DNA_ID=CAMNT_0026933037 /DNA_START=98 /DNA_END=265 /DNA_ORIENTATION=-